MRSFHPWPIPSSIPLVIEEQKEQPEIDWVIPPPPPLDVPPAIVDQVFCIPQDITAAFEVSEEIDPSLVTKLAAVNATPLQVAESINLFVKSSFFEAAIDQLCEYSFSLETSLADLTNTLLGAQRTFKRFRKKSHQDDR